jgi:murein DD-endopeptidase MepM/ murein hydrolase activator NlpD
MYDAGTGYSSPETNGSYRNPWVWPLPGLNGTPPRLLPHVDPERVDIDLGYRDGTSLPRFVPVFAARDGAVTFVGKLATGGYGVSIEHPGGWCTQYAGIEHMFVAATSRRRRKTRVRAGDVLGYARGTDAFRVRFALLRITDEETDEFEIVDPSCLSCWLQLPWHDEPRAPAHSNQIAA